MPPPVENTALLIFGKFLRSGAFNGCGLGKEIFIPSSVKKNRPRSLYKHKRIFKNKMRSSAKTAGWAEDWHTGNAKIEWGAKN